MHLSDDSFRLRRVLSRLDECQSDLAGTGNVLTSRLLQMAALEIRLRINSMGDDELKELTDSFGTQTRKSATIISINQARSG